MEKNNRFQVIYTQGTVDIIRVLLDTETGILYLQTACSNAGGLTVLLDSGGKPARWAPTEKL